jgi:hypothetical protein
MNVDFGAQTLGGGASNIATTGTLATTAAIGTINFAALAGTASVVLTPTFVTSSFIQTATLDLATVGGIPAKTATISVVMWTGVAPGSPGSATGSR